MLESYQDVRLAKREAKGKDTVVKVGSVLVGGPSLVIIAGPCAVESQQQLIDAALAVKDAGAHILRGGAIKPRTSPYSFQGLGEEGLVFLAKARELTGLPVVTEVLEIEDVRMAKNYVDILQVGSRNMQNFSLLRAVGNSGKPVILKRGFAATLEEWLLAAEYIMCSGSSDIILCERGIRTYQNHTRNTMDVAAIPVLKSLTHLPIIADPSHATGRADLVQAVAMASVAAGAHGLMIEVHPEPKKALCDGQQSLTPQAFKEMVALTRYIDNNLRAYESEKREGYGYVPSNKIKFY